VRLQITFAPRSPVFCMLIPKASAPLRRRLPRPSGGNGPVDLPGTSPVDGCTANACSGDEHERPTMARLNVARPDLHDAERRIVPVSRSLSSFDTPAQIAPLIPDRPCFGNASHRAQTHPRMIANRPRPRNQAVLRP